MRAPKVKRGQELIVKVTFDSGDYQGKVVAKKYVKAGVLSVSAPVGIGAEGAIAADKG